MARRCSKNYFQREPGAPAPLSVTVTRRLQFSEVDALAIAWHGRYMAFFEEAANELAHKTGLTYAAYREAGIGAPIAQLHVDYFQPLLLDEKFSITASMIWCEAARLNIEYRILNAAGECTAAGYTVQMFYTLDKREPLWLVPPLVETMRQKWRAGVWHE